MPTDLLPAQESHWELMCAMSPEEPGASPFLVADNRFVHAPLDVPAMRRAIDDVTARHDALRMVFDDVGLQPRLRIEPTVEPPTEFDDLSALDPDEQRIRIGQLTFRQSRWAFALRSGPAWRVWCLRLGPERFLVGACFAEIVADGWATKVFIEDLLSAYAAHAAGTGAGGFPDRPLSFGQMRAAQLDRLEPRADRLEHWRSSLLPLIEHEPLFAAQLSGGTSIREIVRIHRRFPDHLQVPLRRLAWRARTTTYVVLMAAYHVLLTTMTGRDRTVLGTVALGRASRAERRSLLPCTIDTYVATTLPPELTLGEAVQRTRDAVAATFDNLVSFTSLAEAVDPQWAVDRPRVDLPPCDAGFLSSAFEDPELTVAGLTVTMPRLRLARTDEPVGPELTFEGMTAVQRAAWAAYCAPCMEITPDRTECVIQFNSQMYPGEQMRHHVDDYVRVVELMAAAPETPIRAVCP